MSDSAVPAVSVIVTVYNREAYLSACLDSILASSWDDFEVLVADDLSTDSSVSIAESFAARDPRVRVIRNERNLGDYPNRNHAAGMARGEYVKYVDSDDTIYRYGLATMVEAMQANPDAALGLSHSLPEDDEPYPWKLSPAAAWRKEFLGDGCMGCGPSGAIIRREPFSDAGGFGNWGVLSDTDLWYRMSSRWPIVLLPPGLVWWRRHSGQEYTKDDARLVYLRRGFELALESLSATTNPLSKEETIAATKRVRLRYARRVLSVATRGRSPVVARRLAREAGLTAEEILQGLRRAQ
jgi:glycosyltransferase involved in cell wall biosynthesis